jgi:hypothetical protein
MKFQIGLFLLMLVCPLFTFAGSPKKSAELAELKERTLIVVKQEYQASIIAKLEGEAAKSGDKGLKGKQDLENYKSRIDKANEYMMEITPKVWTLSKTVVVMTAQEIAAIAPEAKKGYAVFTINEISKNVDIVAHNPHWVIERLSEKELKTDYPQACDYYLPIPFQFDEFALFTKIEFTVCLRMMQNAIEDMINSVNGTQAYFTYCAWESNANCQIAKSSELLMAREYLRKDTRDEKIAEIKNLTVKPKGYLEDLIEAGDIANKIIILEFVADQIDVTQFRPDPSLGNFISSFGSKYFLLGIDIETGKVCLFKPITEKTIFPVHISQGMPCY